MSKFEFIDIIIQLHHIAVQYLRVQDYYLWQSGSACKQACRTIFSKHRFCNACYKRIPSIAISQVPDTKCLNLCTWVCWQHQSAQGTNIGLQAQMLHANFKLQRKLFCIEPNGCNPSGSWSGAYRIPQNIFSIKSLTRWSLCIVFSQ